MLHESPTDCASLLRHQTIKAETKNNFKKNLWHHPCRQYQWSYHRWQVGSSKTGKHLLCWEIFSPVKRFFSLLRDFFVLCWEMQAPPTIAVNLPLPFHPQAHITVLYVPIYIQHLCDLSWWYCEPPWLSLCLPLSLSLKQRHTPVRYFCDKMGLRGSADYAAHSW